MTPIQRIRLAQDFFRFAYLIGGPISFGLRVDIPPPGLFVYGKHSFSAEEAKLDSETFALCGTILDRLAYRLLAMELDAALEHAFHEARFQHSDAFIRDTSTIIRQIRNAVAHDVLDPVWKIKTESLRDKEITITDILTFKTASLDGKPLKRDDFGGPIALFRLSEKVVTELERIETSPGTTD